MRVVARLARSARLRTVLVAAGALALLVVAIGGGYWMLRDSSAFAVDRIVVEGADETARADALEALEREVRGQSLLAVSADGLAADLRELPTVRLAKIDRDFPSTLRVTVWAERPVAVGRLGTAKLLVSSTGRVIRVLGDSEDMRLPRVWLPPGTPPQAGELLSDPFARQSIEALAALPPRFGVPIQKAEADREHGIVLTLAQGGVQVRLGPPFDLRLKLRAAARLLAAVPPGDLPVMDYLDVRAPLRPALRSEGGDPETATLVAESQGTATDATGAGSQGTGEAGADAGATPQAEDAAEDSATKTTTQTTTETTAETSTETGAETAPAGTSAAESETSDDAGTTSEDAVIIGDAPAADLSPSTAP